MHNSIKRRILFVSISFTLLMGLLASAISYSIFYHYNKDSLAHSTELNVQHIASAINEETDAVESLVRWCQHNALLLPYQLYTDRTGTARRGLYKRLSDQYDSKGRDLHVQRLVVSDFSEYYVQIVPATYSTTANVPNVIMEQDYFTAALESDNLDLSMGFVEDSLVRGSKPVLPVIRPIYNPYNSSVLGWVLAELQPAAFCDALATYSIDSPSSFYVTIAGNVYAYVNGSLEPIDGPLWDEGAEGRGQLYSDTVISDSLSGGRGQYVTRPLNLDGCYITQSIPSSDFYTQTRSVIYLILAIFAAVLLSGMIFTWYLNRVVNRPIERLLSRIKIISTGNFDVDPDIEWDNEFGDIGRGINELSASVKDMIETRVEIENEKREYEYKMLQSQINPHFLYNTLNSIKWMASIQNATGIPEMTTALSRLLKSIAKDDRQRVPIETELSFLDDYYTIQKYRYGGGITMETVVEDATLAGNEILRFTLQPIVENAIFHGIEPKGSVGQISIRVYRTDAGDVGIDVTDNGIGMDEATLSGLLENDGNNSSNFFKDIGIANVHKRLRYEYGEGYGLSFSSEVGVYTTVTVTLPEKPCQYDKEETGCTSS